jgi:branched-chain amino acid transport system ATP-binding protein
MNGATLLSLDQVETYYGRSQALFGVSFEVAFGEAVALLGRNGMGKTTTVRSILGMSRAARGQIRFEGKNIEGSPSFRNARRGIGLVPEGRRIFPNLSVEENLVAMARSSGSADPWSLSRIYAFFPRLAERRQNMGGQLSGGEQQMLAIGRALMTNPKLLILDEATEGLAPLVRLEIWRCLDHLRTLGQAFIVIDKNVDHLLRITDRVIVMEKGAVAWTGTTSEFSTRTGVRDRYLGV